MTTLTSNGSRMNQQTASSTDACTVRGPGEGPRYRVVGDVITFKLGPAETGGQYVLGETVVPPGGGPPPHRHNREDELFYVLDGDFVFALDGKTIAGSRGFSAFLPKGSLHTFKNVGDHPGRFLVVATPCGFEQFITDCAGGRECADPDGAPCGPPTQQEVDRLMAACAKHGLELHFDHKPDGQLPPRDADRELWVLGAHVRVKQTAADTGGRFTLAEITCQPGGGVPPHLHHVEDEVFYVLEGTFEFALADVPGAGAPMRPVTAMPGSLIRVPKGTLHGFRNIGHTPGKLIDYHTPGGFERFFEEAGVPCLDADKGPPQGELDMAKVADCLRRHGMELPGPA